MASFFGAALNGTAGVNTIGNRCYFLGVAIRGSIMMDNLIANPSQDLQTDLIFRETLLKPKDPYFSLATVENSVANSFPAFNTPW